MKNLILSIAILLVGTVNAQSFKDHKDLLANTSGSSTEVSSMLNEKGFSSVDSSTVISMNYLNINEPASVYMNGTTREVVKVSENNVEYIFDGYKKVVMKDTKRSFNEENLLYAMTKKIEGGFNDLTLSRTWWIGEEDTSNGYGAFMTKKFGKTYIRRVVDVNDDKLNCLIVYK